MFETTGPRYLDVPSSGFPTDQTDSDRHHDRGQGVCLDAKPNVPKRVWSTSGVLPTSRAHLTTHGGNGRDRPCGVSRQGDAYRYAFRRRRQSGARLSGFTSGLSGQVSTPVPRERRAVDASLRQNAYRQHESRPTYVWPNRLRAVASLTI